MAEQQFNAFAKSIKLFEIGVLFSGDKIDASSSMK
jgi:hypothetical protein